MGEIKKRAARRGARPLWTGIFSVIAFSALISCDFDIKGMHISGEPEFNFKLGSVLQGTKDGDSDTFSFLDELKASTLEERVQDSVTQVEGEETLKARVWNNVNDKITVMEGGELFVNVDGANKTQVFVIYYPGFSIEIKDIIPVPPELGGPIIPVKQEWLDKIPLSLALPNISEFMKKSPVPIKFKYASLFTYLYTTDGICSGHMTLQAGGIRILDGDVKTKNHSFPGDMPEDDIWSGSLDYDSATAVSDITSLLNEEGEGGNFSISFSESDPLEIDTNETEFKISLGFGIVLPMSFELVDAQDITDDTGAAEPKEYQKAELSQFDTMRDTIDDWLQNLNGGDYGELLKTLHLNISGIQNNIVDGAYIAVSKTPDGGVNLSDWKTPVVELKDGEKNPDPWIFENIDKFPKIAIFVDKDKDWTIKPQQAGAERKFDFYAKIKAIANVALDYDF